MADDEKLTALTEETAPAWDDLVYLVKDPAGSPLSRKVKRGNAIRGVKGADIASASALPVGTDGNCWDVTGNTTITSINSLSVGTVIRLHFNASLTLTHHATDLILPGGANITTAAGDEFTLVEYASGDWRVTAYALASGEAIVGGSGGGLEPESYWGGNLIKNYPSLELADGAQPEWWEKTNDCVLTEVSAADEGVPAIHERLLKLVISSDGGGVDFAFQSFYEANEPTLDDSVTKVSSGYFVYQKSTDISGTITLELYDEDGAASLGTATTAIENAWTWVEINDKTYQDSLRARLTHSANSATVYIAMPSLNVGATVLPWKARGLRFIENDGTEVLNINPSISTYVDLDLSSYCPANTVQFGLTLQIKTNSGGSASFYVRRNGSSVDVKSLNAGTSTTSVGVLFPLGDDQKIIEYRTNVDSRVDELKINLSSQYVWA